MLHEMDRKYIKVLPVSQKNQNVKSVRPNKITQPEPNMEFGTLIGDRQITIMLPIRTVSEANCFEPWQKRHSRHKLQKKAVFAALLGCKEIIQLPCTLRFTRFAPKFLDAHDNLRISMKYLLDSCCAEITGDHRPGLADGNSGFTFLYDQVKSKVYAVKIQIMW